MPLQKPLFFFGVWGMLLPIHINWYCFHGAISCHLRMAAYEGGYGHTRGSYAKAVRMRGGTSVMWSIWDPKMVINRVTRAPPGLIFIENAKQDTRNPILRTPRPGDPYSYQLCPPEISRKIQIFGGHGACMTVPPLIRRCTHYHSLGA